MELAAIFSIDVAAYSVMSNHYHIILRVDENRALSWSDHEVFTRWIQLFTGPDVVRRYLAQTGDLTHSDQHQLAELAGLYRNRLYDISWFMRMLNESVARKANQEEGISGRFWEGRFKSQALLDEKAILAAMAYVDLNPVRAGMAATPEDSEYTSIKERLDALKVSPALNVPGNAPLSPAPQTTKTLVWQKALQQIGMPGRQPSPRGWQGQSAVLLQELSVSPAIRIPLLPNRPLNHRIHPRIFPLQNPELPLPPLTTSQIFPLPFPSDSMNMQSWWTGQAGNSGERRGASVKKPRQF
jgi:REP element-mobilizing transposase RayT